MARRHPDALVTALAGALVGMAVFELSFGISLANPFRIDWLMGGGDVTGQFIGWHMFRSEAWTLPLGSIQSFGYPVGTSVGLTDSNPLMAVPFKAATRFLRRDFHYVGLWLLLSFTMQGVFGALLMRTVSASRWVQIPGATLFVLAPPLIHRWGHAALATHWLLLAALWMYVVRGRETSLFAAFGAWALLLAITAAVNPYLLAMVFAIACAYFVRLAIVRRGAAVKSAILAPAVLLLLALLVQWQSGDFIVSGLSDLQALGLGFYSMNLLAPIMPLGSSTLFGSGPVAPATQGQYEGYSYLGAGMLLLAGVAVLRPLFSSARRVPHLSIEDVPLMVMLALLTLLALSPRITAGPRTLLEYPSSWWGPLTVFRASGRLFWVVHYALVFGIIRSVARARPLVAGVVLSVAVIVQTVDLSALYRGVRSLRASSWTNPLASDFWDSVPASYAHLTMLPSNMCAAPGEAIDYAPFSLLAGRHHLTINAGYAGRFDVQRLVNHCLDFQRRTRDGTVSSDELYITLPKLIPEFASRAAAPVVCTIIDGYGVCFVKDTYVEWQDSFDLTADLLPPASDLRAFYDALESIYRDELHRSRENAYGAASDRVRIIARYVTYRRSGCGSEEAEQKIAREVGGKRELRLCATHRPGRGDFPPPDEVLQFLRRVERYYHQSDQARVGSTHVDPEGEAVWMLEYIRHRQQGRGHREATDAVSRRIRDITQ